MCFWGYVDYQQKCKMKDMLLAEALEERRAATEEAVRTFGKSDGVPTEI